MKKSLFHLLIIAIVSASSAGALHAATSSVASAPPAAAPGPGLSGGGGTGLSGVLAPLEGKQITCVSGSYYGAAKVVSGQLYTLAYNPQNPAYHSGWIAGKRASYLVGSSANGTTYTAIADATGVNISRVTCSTCSFDYCTTTCATSPSICATTWPVN